MRRLPARSAFIHGQALFISDIIRNGAHLVTADGFPLAALTVCVNKFQVAKGDLHVLVGLTGKLVWTVNTSLDLLDLVKNS